jgi:hypothetical protein
LIKDITDTRRGLSQGSINVRKDTDYLGYLWLKVPDGTEQYHGTITIALEEDTTGGTTYASALIKNTFGDWKKYSFRLHSTSSDRNAKLSILFDGTGSLWMDEVSLMPADAVGGIRPPKCWQKFASYGPLSFVGPVGM